MFPVNCIYLRVPQHYSPTSSKIYNSPHLIVHTNTNFECVTHETSGIPPSDLRGGVGVCAVFPRCTHAYDTLDWGSLAARIAFIPAHPNRNKTFAAPLYSFRFCPKHRMNTAGTLQTPHEIDSTKCERSYFRLRQHLQERRGEEKECTIDAPTAASRRPRLSKNEIYVLIPLPTPSKASKGPQHLRQS